MNPTREEALFVLALEKPAEKRHAFLDAMCDGDAALRQRLEALLAEHEPSDARLTTPAEAEEPTIELNPADMPDDAVGMTLGRYKLLERVGEGGCGTVYVAEQTEPVRRRVALKVIKLGMDTREVIARFEAERQALAMMDHPNIARVLDAGMAEVGGRRTEDGGPASDLRSPSSFPGRPYFVMELVRGIRITDYCDQANLSTKERLDLFIKVCQAIQHAHQKGIIHRDIKPSNILVTLHDGVPVPKVIDFGIAKATEGRLTDNTVYTQLHQFIGTPAYMSPEQAEMSGLDIDTRSDIYSLGVLLYELLVGRTPFDAKDLLDSGLDAMRRTIREKEPARPSTRLAALAGEELTTTSMRRSVEAPRLIRQLQGDLDWIVMRCLEKDRTRRYDTANGLAADLKRHLANEPVTARPPTVAYAFQKAFRRNKLLFTAGATVAAALVLGIGVSTWQAIRATRAEREQNKLREVAVSALDGEREQRAQAQAEQQRADAEARKASESQQQSRRLLYASDMNLAQQALKLNNLGRARRLLDRHRPQPGEEDLRGWEWRYLWQLTRSSALVTLTNRPSVGFSVSFSPDGTRLAVGWFDGRVDLWDVPGQRLVRPLTDREQPHQGRVAFSPVSNRLAATSEPMVVTLYDIDSGQESVLWRAPDQAAWDVRDLAFSPDGSRVIIYAGSTREAGDAVWVVNAASAQIESHHPTDYSDDYLYGAAQLSPDNRRLYLARSDGLNNRYAIQCLDLNTGQELWQTERERDRGLTTLALSPDGRMLVSGSGFEDPSIHVWDATTGRLLVRLVGHSFWVSKLVFTRDGRRLISAGADQCIRFWDTSNWTETQVLRGHTDEVHAVAISEPAHLVASAGNDGNLILWKEDGKSAVDGYTRLPAHLGDDQVRPLDHARVLLLPKEKPPELVDLKGDSSPVPLPEIGAAGNVLGWSGTNMLCLWNGTNQILIRELRGSEAIPRGTISLNSGMRPAGLAYNVTRQLLAWTEGSSPTSVHLASVAEPGRRIELRSDGPELVPFRFSEDGKYLAAWAWSREGEERELRVWNVETGQILASIGESVYASTFAAGGRVLVAAIAKGSDHEIRFYDLANPDRAPRGVPGQHASRVLAVSPDGDLVASSTDGGQVRLFDPAKGELIVSLHGHLGAAIGLAFSPDGRRLISSSGGREALKLWDVGTRQELLTLGGAGSLLNKARWSADGDVILVGSPWQAWRAPSWQEIAVAEPKEKAPIKQP